MKSILTTPAASTIWPSFTDRWGTTAKAEPLYRQALGIYKQVLGEPQARLPNITGMDSALSSRALIPQSGAGPQMAMGVVTWYDFPRCSLRSRSKTIVGANMSTTMTFVEEFRVTDATSADEPTGKSRLVIVMDN